MTGGSNGRQRVLRHLRAPGRASNLEAVLTPDGGIQIDGLDSGNGAAEADEYLHYRWTWRIAAADIPEALAAIGGAAQGDALDVLEAWVVEHGGDPGMAIRKAGAPIEFSSRLGD